MCCNYYTIYAVGLDWLMLLRVHLLAVSPLPGVYLQPTMPRMTLVWQTCSLKREFLRFLDYIKLTELQI